MQKQTQPCAGCGQARQLHVDWDPVTMQTRGHLCRGCRTSLGRLGGRAETVRAHIASGRMRRARRELAERLLRYLGT